MSVFCNNQQECFVLGVHGEEGWSWDNDKVRHTKDEALATVGEIGGFVTHLLRLYVDDHGLIQCDSLGLYGDFI